MWISVWLHIQPWFFYADMRNCMPKIIMQMGRSSGARGSCLTIAMLVISAWLLAGCAGEPRLPDASQTSDSPSVLVDAYIIRSTIPAELLGEPGPITLQAALSYPDHPIYPSASEPVDHEISLEVLF